MPTKPRSRLIAAWALAALATITLPAVSYLAWDQATYNFGTVQPGRIYRSGQMPATALAETVRNNRIKTVLNLRGANQRDAWYRDEVAASNGAGATQYDVAMSSCVWMSRAQLRAVIHVLGTAEYPMIIHCAWGSERTGLVSAFAELLRPGSTIEQAKAQFSIAYLFVPVGDGKVMAEHLEQYEKWLKENHLTHESAVFRQWVDSGFCPGTPSREQWPYDPYPLVVVTRPNARREATPVGRRADANMQRK
jgi:protein tyrosine phosphatase (PTP) superfamily phosphohydrolase (DUF442 family)